MASLGAGEVRLRVKLRNTEELTQVTSLLGGVCVCVCVCARARVCVSVCVDADPQLIDNMEVLFYSWSDQKDGQSQKYSDQSQKNHNYSQKTDNQSQKNDNQSEKTDNQSQKNDNQPQKNSDRSQKTGKQAPPAPKRLPFAVNGSRVEVVVPPFEHFGAVTIGATNEAALRAEASQVTESSVCVCV